MAGVSNVYRLIIIILLVYIVWVDHMYIQASWCESEIDILRTTVAEIHTMLKNR